MREGRQQATFLASLWPVAYAIAMDVSGWLRANGFERFVDLFEENEIDGDVLGELTGSDLADMGIPLGPRKKLLKAIEALVAQDAGASGEPAAPAATGESDVRGAAERRQLTVMFVDLVGSTAMAEQLDPEDMREVITSYQNLVAGAVTRFEGQVAKYMGDGVLCYFGWPRAHEDDAERSVRAGMALMQALAKLKRADGQSLSARAGVATGVVVVGDLIGEGAAQEEAVVGETPNLAARIQDVAGAGQIVVSEATRQLLGDVFELEGLGRHALKGISGGTSVYAVTGERVAESRFDARSSGTISAMVGREHELALMMERWKQAKAGEGQLLLLSGEAGIGKSRITRAMIDSVSNEEHVRLNLQCSPYHSDSSFYPAVQQLTHASGIKEGDSQQEQLDKLETLFSGDDVAVVGKLFGLNTEQRYGALDLSPPQLRARTLQAFVNKVVSLSKEQQVLFVLEDAHWIDASTLEMLDLCLEYIASERVLMLVTARPTFEHGFGGHPIVTRLALNRLGREQIASIVGKISGGKTLPDKLLQEIADKTDGVPLFVEELTKTVLESGELEETDTAWVLTGPLSRLAIPATLHDSLMARLDRLQPVKEVAQTAACIGRQFDYALLEIISSLKGEALAKALDQLTAAELIFRRGIVPEATFIFKHALVRDAAYESLLKSRRQTIHAKLVEALEAAEQSAPEILAYHSEQSGQREKALRYWRMAGDTALAQPAYAEAVSHFKAALALIGKLENPLDWQEFELELHLQLATVYLAINGYGSEEAVRAFTAAEALLQPTGRTDLVVPVGYGVWISHYLRAEHIKGEALGRKLVRDVEHLDDAVAHMVANRLLAASLIGLGRPHEARGYLETALAHYEPNLLVRFSEQFAQEPGIQIRAYLIISLFLLGFPDQAFAHLAQSEAAAAELDHVNTICYGSFHWATLGFLSRNDEVTRRCNATLHDVSHLHGLVTWQHYGRIGDLLLKSKSGDTGALEQLPNEFEKYTSSGQWVFMPYFKTEQVRLMLVNGDVEQALIEYGETIRIMERTSESWMLAELQRLHGDIRLAQDCPEDAEEAYRLSLDTARVQKARAWELRTATSLARLWADQGKKPEAREFLQPVYSGFSEGFTLPDLTEAKALLQQLG